MDTEKTSDLNSHDVKSVIKLKRNLQFLINSIAVLFPFIFAFLTFKNITLQGFLEFFANPEAFVLSWNIVLAIYFASWIVGSKYELDKHELIVRFAPKDGELSFGVLAHVSVAAVAGAAILYMQSYIAFVSFLFLFHLINIIGRWHQVRRYSSPMIIKTRDYYRRIEDHISEIQANILYDHVCGTWKIKRFAVGFILLVPMLLIALTPEIDATFMGSIDFLGIHTTQLVSLALFVLIMEGWVWLRRLQLSSRLHVLSEMRGQYAVTPLD